MMTYGHSREASAMELTLRPLSHSLITDHGMELKIRVSVRFRMMGQFIILFEKTGPLGIKVCQESFSNHLVSNIARKREPGLIKEPGNL